MLFYFTETVCHPFHVVTVSLLRLSSVPGRNKCDSVHFEFGFGTRNTQMLVLLYLVNLVLGLFILDGGSWIYFKVVSPFLSPARHSRFLFPLCVRLKQMEKDEMTSIVFSLSMSPVCVRAFVIRHVAATPNCKTRREHIAQPNSKWFRKVLIGTLATTCGGDVGAILRRLVTIGLAHTELCPMKKFL